MTSFNLYTHTHNRRQETACGQQRQYSTEVAIKDRTSLALLFIEFRSRFTETTKIHTLSLLEQELWKSIGT